MDWSRGYTARWRVFRVDPETWADAGLVARLDGASVERTRSGMLESATLAFTREVGEGFSPGYHRIALYAEQDGASVREDVATLYCTSASGEVDYGRDAVAVTGRSVLFPASVRRLLAGTYAPKGCDGAAYAADLLRECVHAPVEVDGSFRLGRHVVFDLGDSHLDAAWAVLDAGRFCMQVTGSGTVRVMPLPAEPDLVLGADGLRMLMPGASHALDYSDVPNRVLVRHGANEALAVNDDPESETSTVARGYCHDLVEESATPVDGETLADYARRRLAEESAVADSRTYEREYAPGVLPSSVVRASLSEIGMVGDFRVVRQSLDLGHGVKVTERAEREVATWRA